MPPTERPIRAVFFDAGNTLLRMNYAVIAAELVSHGVRVAPEEVQRAEWRARGLLGDYGPARFPPGGSPQKPPPAPRHPPLLPPALGLAGAASDRKRA